MSSKIGGKLDYGWAWTVKVGSYNGRNLIMNGDTVEQIDQLIHPTSQHRIC